MSLQEIINKVKQYPQDKWEVIDFGSFLQLKNQYSESNFDSLYLTLPDPDNNFYEMEFREDDSQTVIFIKRLHNAEDLDEVKELFDLMIGVMSTDVESEKNLTDFKLFFL